MSNVGSKSFSNVAAAVPVIGVTSIVAASKTTTSSSYVDHDAVNSKLVFEKLNAETSVLILIDFSLYTTVASVTGTIGINDGTNDIDVIPFTINPANQHTSVSGGKKISGLATGTYTFNLRWKRNSGTGTFTTDAGDRVYISAQEVL